MNKQVQQSTIRGINSLLGYVFGEITYEQAMENIHSMNVKESDNTTGV